MKMKKEQAIKMLIDHIKDGAMVDFEGAIQAHDESCLTSDPPERKAVFSGEFTISYSYTEEG